MNVPPSVGMAVSSGKATMAELSTVLGIEDLHDILEVVIVDAHNDRIMRKKREQG